MNQVSQQKYKNLMLDRSKKTTSWGCLFKESFCQTRKGSVWNRSHTSSPWAQGINHLAECQRRIYRAWHLPEADHSPSFPSKGMKGGHGYSLPQHPMLDGELSPDICAWTMFHLITVYFQQVLKTDVSWRKYFWICLCFLSLCFCFCFSPTVTFIVRINVSHQLQMLQTTFHAVTSKLVQQNYVWLTGCLIVYLLLQASTHTDFPGQPPIS